MKFDNILGLIGNTPVVRLSKLFPHHEVWVKLERQNPAGSIKDRIALAMIEGAEKRGELKAGMTVVEPTSGNTGVALAMVCAFKGYKLILVMPESMSVERRALMKAYGAQFELTARKQGMKGAIARAQELAANKDCWMPMQFENEDNLRVHREMTAKEVLADFPQGVEVLISGVGTGGHLTSVGRVLKEKFGTRVIAVEPVASPVLSGGAPGPHPLQGIGAGFIPKIMDIELLDGIYQITKEEAFEMVQLAATQEGLLGGISSGASLAAVKKYLVKHPETKSILTFNYDSMERYLSIEGLIP
jgi:cysteine synthase A